MVDDPTAGGILVADLNGDDRLDFLVTVPGRIIACDNTGQSLWTHDADLVLGGPSEYVGLPGHHAPGVAAGDVNGDGLCEVLFLTRDKTLHILDGRTGTSTAMIRPAVPEGAARWELVLTADFRGVGDDRDILLQATNKGGYRVGRYLAAYDFDTLLHGGPPIWTRDNFLACAHSGARLADVDGDGLDEVIGGEITDHDGTRITRAVPSRSHFDAVTVADVRPDLPGIEVILLEEGDDHVQLMSIHGPIWRRHFRRQEPQNMAVGRFKPESEAYFIWCRSRHNRDQKPFVFDAFGHVVTWYRVADTAPSGWTKHGVEVIHTIDWTGGPTQLACAKERHTAGDVALFEPLTGRFVLHIKETADRLHVADVLGDWREEIIVKSDDELHIYSNQSDNPDPDRPRLWRDRNYRRLKHSHNYYAP